MKKIIIPIVSLLIMAGCTPTLDEKIKQEEILDSSKTVLDTTINTETVLDTTINTETVLDTTITNETVLDSSIDGTKESQEYLESQLKD